MSSAKVARNRVVSITYSVTDEAGEVLEQVDIPVSYLHGGPAGLYEPIEEALEGCAVGDSIAVPLSPAEGFGERDPSLTFTDAIENVPPQFRKLGAEAEFRNEAGETVKMVVTHIDEGSITLDGNHPFAGKTVTFRVTVQEIRAATAQELRSGEVEQPSQTVH